MAIGIRIDELKRATEKPKIIYPLISEFPSTKLAVNRWWFKQKFDLNLKEYEGNCDLCWKKSKRKLLTIISENPKTTEWWQSMEIKYENHVPVSQQAKRITPIHFFREDTSVSELLEDSSTAFVKATDIFTLADLMGSEPDLDFTDGCSESCEAF